MSILLWSLVALVATAIIWKGSDWLEVSSSRLSTHYELPEVVQGAIVVAVGSSFPELSTTVLSTLLHGEFELGASAIVGSALFNVLVIPALSSLFSKERLLTNRDLVYKEALFYMIAVSVLMLTFSFAVIYEPVPGPEGVLQGTMTRGLALLPLVLYALYLFVQWQDTMEYEPEPQHEEIKPGREWLRLLASLAVILLGVEGLVQAAVSFGEIFGTPSFLWGVTVVAAGTSIPDAFVSVKVARQGKSITSLANVLGSNIFDLLVCIPAGVLIAGAAVINFSVTGPMMGVLTLATVALFLMMRTSMVLSRWEAALLLVLYAAFVAWMGLETFEVVDLIPGLPPAPSPG
jgi:cation:H+ antiporter